MVLGDLFLSAHCYPLTSIPNFRRPSAVAFRPLMVAYLIVTGMKWA